MMMRCAAEPLGLHDVSVSSGSGVLATTDRSVGFTVNQGFDILYTNVPACVCCGAQARRVN